MRLGYTSFAPIAHLIACSQQQKTSHLDTAVSFTVAFATNLRKKATVLSIRKTRIAQLTCLGGAYELRRVVIRRTERACELLCEASSNEPGREQHGENPKELAAH